MKKIDPLTNEEFIPKRKSQKFASPENRKKYNNQKATELREERAYLEKPLHKNHKILKEIMGSDIKKTINKYFLLGKGFDFNAFNHYTTIEKFGYPSVYEFCFRELTESDNIIIQKI